MAMPRFWVTTSSQSATLLYTRNTHKGHIGRLASLPLVVRGNIMALSSGMDNIIAALGQSNRLCDVFLSYLVSWQLEEVLVAMQVSFPALIALHLASTGETLLAIPDSFLGGPAPRLQSFGLHAIPFPGLPKLLLSTNHPVRLDLSHIPHSGYISPEAMAMCLSLLTSLDTLSLGFSSSRSRPDRKSRRLTPTTRSILPDLTSFQFEGASEYLEDLVARVDAPRLDNLSITFFPQMNFDTPHLVQFISRTPAFQEPNEAHVAYTYDLDDVVRLVWASDDYRRLCVGISPDELDLHLSSITQICTMCLPPLPTVENLRLGAFTESRDSEMSWNGNVDQWSEFLHPFTGVKSLYLSVEFQPNMASALQKLVGTAEVLPSLQNIFLERPEPSGAFQEAIGQFVAARQLSGHPIAIYAWD